MHNNMARIRLTIKRRYIEREIMRDTRCHRLMSVNYPLYAVRYIRYTRPVLSIVKGYGIDQNSACIRTPTTLLSKAMGAGKPHNVSWKKENI